MGKRLLKKHEKIKRVTDMGVLVVAGVMVLSVFPGSIILTKINNDNQLHSRIVNSASASIQGEYIDYREGFKISLGQKLGDGEITMNEYYRIIRNIDSDQNIEPWAKNSQNSEVQQMYKDYVKTKKNIDVSEKTLAGILAGGTVSLAALGIINHCATKKQKKLFGGSLSEELVDDDEKEMTD